MPFPTITTIESPRLTLRPAVIADIADLLPINGDDEVTRFLPYASWRSLADGLAWLTRMDALAVAGTGQQLVVVRRDTAQLVGSLLLFKHDETSQRLELGYVLGRSHWGQGLMREAVVAACGHVFVSRGMRRIEAEVNPANTASCKLLLNVGFTHEGTLRQRWVSKGAPYDTHIFGCLAQEWQAGPGR